MTMVDMARRKLSLGRVFSDTFGVVRREARLLFGFAFVLYLLPTLVSGALTRAIAPGLAAATGAQALALFKSPIYWILLLVGLFINMILLASLTQIAIADLEGGRPATRDVLQLALRKCLPLLATVLLLVIGLWLGMLFLLVPAFILAAMWAVTLPAMVAETSNVMRAFGRSRALTKGNRWRIVGLLLVVLVLGLIVDGVALALMGGARGSMAGGPLAIGAAIVLGVVGLVVSVLITVGDAALYVQLRELKGGGGESVAQVFA
jgi:hypothetical protein